LAFDAVSCIIPGASKMAHVESNLSVYDLPELSAEKIARMNEIYEKYIKSEVHHLW
jgi:aryl-alcohol dehydrogenase-like predicted oxidoreductase